MAARVPQTVPRHEPWELLRLMRAAVFCIDAEFRKKCFQELDGSDQHFFLVMVAFQESILDKVVSIGEVWSFSS